MDPRLPEDRNTEVFNQPPRTRTPHVETAREARQGPLGRPILYVLVGGLILAAIYLIATQIWSNSEPLPPAGQIEDTTVPATPDTPALTPVPETPAPAMENPAPAMETPAPAMENPAPAMDALPPLTPAPTPEPTPAPLAP